MPSAAGGRYSAEQYLRLVDEGVLGPDDRVELLEGVVVAMTAENAPHASAGARVTAALFRAVVDRAVVRPRLTFVAGDYSVPEPDVAVVPGQYEDYDRIHPRTALLIVEVADTSLPQDRLTKTGIYAAAGSPSTGSSTSGASASRRTAGPSRTSVVIRLTRLPTGATVSSSPRSPARSSPSAISCP
jgi:Uma2 family endonuclease